MIKVTPLAEFEDLHIKDEKENNYLAEIFAKTAYQYQNSHTSEMNHNTCRFEKTHFFQEDFTDYERHQLLYIDKKAFLIIKEQLTDCCEAKNGDMVICVAYTLQEYRDQGYMNSLLSEALRLYKDKRFVVDTYTDELISLSQKLGIVSFKGSF